MRWAEHVTHMRELKCIEKFSREWEKSLGRPRRRWKCKIKVDIEEIRRKYVDWTHLTHSG
jgi:hypothetical protein